MTTPVAAVGSEATDTTSDSSNGAALASNLLEAQAMKPRSRRPTWLITMMQLRDECASSENPFLSSFAKSRLMSLFLEDDRLTQAFGRMNRRRLRKELQESAALESRLRRILPELNVPAESRDEPAPCAPSGSIGAAPADSSDEPVANTPGSEEELVIWDLCCGKGFSSLWLTTNTFPHQSEGSGSTTTNDTISSNHGSVSIHMVDTNGDINFGWLDVFPNLTFHKLDIYSQELEDAMLDSMRDRNDDEDDLNTCRKRKKKKLIVVGIHTCGDLSRRVLELGQRCNAFATLVSPCCCARPVAHRRRPVGSFGYDTAKKARNFKGKVSVYQLWCWMLWGYAQQQQQQGLENDAGKERRHRIDLSEEPLMKTDKNVWLLVVSLQQTGSS